MSTISIDGESHRANEVVRNTILTLRNERQIFLVQTEIITTMLRRAEAETDKMHDKYLDEKMRANNEGRIADHAAKGIACYKLNLTEQCKKIEKLNIHIENFQDVVEALTERADNLESANAALRKENRNLKRRVPKKTVSSKKK